MIITTIPAKIGQMLENGCKLTIRKHLQDKTYNASICQSVSSYCDNPASAIVELETAFLGQGHLDTVPLCVLPDNVSAAIGLLTLIRRRNGDYKASIVGDQGDTVAESATPEGAIVELERMIVREG